MRRISALILLCLAASMGFSQARYTVSDEDAAGPGTPKVVVLRDTVGGLEAAVKPSRLRSYDKEQGGCFQEASA